MKSEIGRLVLVATVVTFLIASVGFAVELLVPSQYGTIQKAVVDPNGLGGQSAAKYNYVPSEILVKFRKPLAEILEGMTEGAQVRELSLSPRLDDLNKKFGLRSIEPVFKNFKAKRQQVKALLEKGKTLLTKQEKHTLRRLSRAPKGVKVPELDRIYKLEVDLEQGQTLEEAVRAYNNDPSIEYAELNYIVSINLTPDDPEYSSQWALPKIDAPEAWDIHTGSSDIIVAVVDTGVDYNHGDLNDNMWTDQNGYHGYDFINNDNDPMDDHGHGTHCAGTIAAEGHNGLDVAGVCWDARIMALKFLDNNGSGSTSDAVTAFYYAVNNGADVTSNSWGGGGYSETLKQAIDYAHSQGVVMVASAGNDASSSPEYPAYYDHMIAVAATNSNDGRASFSNYGDWVDIAAPGVDILSLKLGGGTIWDSGTSMACPHIAGASALVLSLNPFLTCDEVLDTLMDTVDPIAPGICLSNGRVNLFNAAIAVHGIHLTRDYYSCSDEVSIYLVDNDFAAEGSHTVTVTTSGGDLETVVLPEAAAGNGVFTGTILTESGDPNTENGILQVAHGEIITATYENGNDTAVVDCEIPVIFNVGIEVEGFELTVTFETDEATTARVLGGPACGEGYIVEGSDPTLATSHTMTVEATFETNCYFVIEATDEAGNEAIDDNSGNCYTRGVGSVTLDSDYYSCSDVIEVELIDWDLVDQVDQMVTLATDSGDLEAVLLIEESAQPWIFRSTILTSSDSVVPGDGILQVLHGQIITATYEDLDAGTGNPATVSDSAEADCLPPIIFNIQVNDITSSGVDVTFETDEATTARIEYGLTCNEPDIIINDLTLATEHSFYLSGLTPETDYYFELAVWDSVDNETTDDNGGLCYQFTTTAEPFGIHVPGDYPTIQRAINAAVDGDTIIVADGTYTGGGNRDIDFNGKAITVMSENGPENCIINCQGSSSSPRRGFRFHNGEGTDSIVSGFTIKNGFGPEEELPGEMGSIYLPAGGAIFCVSSSPTINNCIFSNNKVLNPDYYNFSRGGAIACKNGSPTISNCTFADNEAGWDGGAIYGYGGSLMIINCNFNSNTSQDGGAIECAGGFPRIENCTISNNRSYGYGGGIFCDDSAATIINCVVNNNTAYNPGMGGASGGGMELQCNRGQVIEVINCTIIGNWAENYGGGLRTSCCGNYEVINSIIWNNWPNQIIAYQTVVTYSDVQGGFSGEGNINANPNFVSGSDYHLTEGSACIDAGTNDVLSGFPPRDLDGTPRPLDGNGDTNDVADMGAYEYWNQPSAPFIATDQSKFWFFTFSDTQNPEDQILSLRNGWIGMLNWQITEDCSWLEVYPTDGDSGGEIGQVTLSIDPTGLSKGDYSCEFSITDPNAANSPLVIPVQLRVGAYLVPQEYATIQEAIDAAYNGNVILVADGIYSGDGNHNIDYQGKIITVMSENGPENCIIDCENLGRAFNFNNSESNSSILNGFTIRNGRVTNTERGAGIRCVDSSPTIVNCRIIDCHADMAGGGIYFQDSTGKVVNTIISDCTGGNNGGAISSKGGYPKILNCTIVGNSAGSGGGYYCSHGCGMVKNSIIWGNSGSEIHNSPAVSYSDVQGGFSGVGNINLNPRFVYSAGGDYHIANDSPCIDSGAPNPSGVWETDIDGDPRVINGRIDMGADEFNDELPIIGCLPTQIGFSSYEGAPDPETQILSIYNIGAGTLSWEIVEDCPWLEVAPTDGNSTGEIEEVTLSVDVSGLGIGTHSCELNIICDDAINSPRAIPVYLHIGNTIYVPSDFETIQEAINAASNGMVVSVAPGTYTGAGNRDLDFGGKEIIVQSTAPYDPTVVAATVIDCQGSASDYHRGFYFHNGEGPDSLVLGLTIINGYIGGGEGRGGGIYCVTSSPTIKYCTFRDNYANKGGGIYLYRPNSTISHCTFTDNRAGWLGGGLGCQNNGTAIINHCVFSGNYGNPGGGISVLFSAKAQISHCILWRNITGGRPRQLHLENGATATVSFSDVQGGEAGVSHQYSYTLNWGAGNINAVPRFVDAAGGDYHLRWDSPCINAGDPGFVADPNEKDIDGEPRVMSGRVDMGADEVYQSPADFDESGQVNFVDHAVFAAAWQSQSGDAHYNEECDLEDDNVINYKDLVLLYDEWLWQASGYEE